MCHGQVEVTGAECAHQYDRLGPAEERSSTCPGDKSGLHQVSEFIKIAWGWLKLVDFRFSLIDRAPSRYLTRTLT